MGIFDTITAHFIGHRSGATVEADPNLLTREARFERAGSDESARTISAILATEQPVPMYDRWSGKVVDEVLMSSGGAFPKKIPLLDSHSRFNSSSVFGSVRDIRMESDLWRGVVHFASEAGDEIDRAWQKVKQGHLEDGSIGYRYERNDYVDIAPGQSGEVKGRSFTAGERTLRVVSNWQAKEFSITPIGADDEAKLGRDGKSFSQDGKPSPPGTEGQNSSHDETDKVRHADSDEKKMPPALLRFLQFLGLRKDAGEDKARSFLENLSDEHRQRAGRIESGAEEFEAPDQSRSEDGNADGQGGQQDGQRQQAVAPSQGAPGQPTGSVIDPRDAIRTERERVAYIREHAQNVPSEVIDRAVNEGWDQARCNAEFLSHFRQRTEPASGYIGIIDGAKSKQTTRHALQAALLMRHGVDLDSEIFDAPEVAHAMSDRSMNAGWITQARRAHRRGGRVDDEASRAMEAAYRYRSISLVDLSREVLSAEGVRFDAYDRGDIFQRAMSSSAVAEIFTTNFAVMFLTGFIGKPDTTNGWVREADLPNLQTVERKQMGKGSPLKKRLRTETAKHMTIDAIGEEYKLAEYAGQFFVDQQDWIDDRFGSLDVMPDEMGEAAAELRPDLIYYILLSNPTMGRDSVALFHADHGNLHTSTDLDPDGLSTVKVGMSTQTKNGRLIGIRPAGLIVPDSKEDIAFEWINSAEKRDTTSSTKYPVRNWAQGRFNVVPEPRLDTGVTDPDSGTLAAGKPGSYFMTAEGGQHGLEVGYLQGTGRRPTIRSFVATEGRFGRGWDVQHFIGAKAIGYEGLAEARE